MTGFQHTLVDESSPDCEHCGEAIKYNAKTAGMPSDTYQAGGLLNGWSHHDGMKRDHEARPPFGVSGEAELTRQNARRDQARMAVRDNLNSRINEFGLGKQVDKIFE